MKQTALAAMLLASLFWPLLIVGIFVPAVAAWAFAFVPLQKWWGVVPVRILSIVLSLTVPPIVGIVTHRLAASSRRKGTALRAALLGYPLAFGYALSCILTAFIVPIVKLASTIRRWDDEHAYVQPREGQYGLALNELARACRSAGVDVRVEDVPLQLSISTKLLKWLARGAVNPLVAEDPKQLTGRDLEVYLYPADLLLRGSKGHVARVRARLTGSMLERYAYLTADPRSQQLEDQISRMWDVLERHRSPDEVGEIGRRRLAEIADDLDGADLPFDEWLVLDRSLRRLELEMGGGTRIPVPTSRTRSNDDGGRPTERASVH